MIGLNLSANLAVYNQLGLTASGRFYYCLTVNDNKGKWLFEEMLVIYAFLARGFVI